ncbi:MAG: hypothetical protein PWR27_1295 [Petroclostridium sp.]|jgi:hypothetical protein|uniref:hypothetical protein n=1 Tax=Petroclostridium xylanilyticum TaxID=1792311 RepID=UPI000B987AF8|nr:hypothetical protein [Petroclostridium xylanilyticum]MBZ4646341.1 hypothetical protein [Clostridia bacterium]MDK2810586.1 hypothetical protein [Petroclostridium sp.]
MDVSRLSNDGLMFHYFSNKKQIELLYKQQKELEDEINKRLDHLRFKAGKGEIIATDAEPIR